MALCAALCLMGVLLEGEFNQPITVQNILAGFRRHRPSASRIETPNPHTAPERMRSAASDDARGALNLRIGKDIAFVAAARGKLETTAPSSPAWNQCFVSGASVY